MPALPWVERQPIDPDRGYVVMASRLPLRSYRFVPGFLLDTLRIRRQLATAGGLVGYALHAQLVRKTFWTFSVWSDQEDLDAFAAADPHQGIIRRLHARMAQSSFAFLRLRGAEIPLNWEARMSLADDAARSAHTASAGGRRMR
jgi:hypothetical protein